MKKLRFRVNSEKPGAAEKYAALALAASRLGFSETDGCDADVVVVLGGDGTILKAVHEFPGVPLLGLNIGGLGYLASVGGGEAEKALKMLADGRYVISERSLLEADGRFSALNDIVITREMSGRSVRLDLEADGRLVTRYMADGLIFATPTGSTAYSLSAGGPVLMPNSKCVVATPLNPHALAVRPLVLSDAVRFKVTARSRAPGNTMRLGVYADGENVMKLDEGDTLEIAKSGKVARLVELEGYDPYGVLARKLGWSGSNVA